MREKLNMKKRDSSPNGYKQKGFELTVPDRPENHIKDIDLKAKIDEIVETLGYDLRISAPSHLTHPEWGRRLVSMYGAKGQVLTYLQAALGVLSEEEKKENLRKESGQHLRGARKSKVFQKILYEEVGEEKFKALMDEARMDNPDLFSVNKDKS